jgi:hypothetical protein
VAKFGSLWVGNPPTRLERLSAQSFLDYGHEFHLFLYDLSYANLFSEKVIVHDARDLLPEDMIFVSRKEKSYAQFSDIFRVRMINEYDLIWVDLDNICLSSEWKWPDFFVSYMHSTAVNNAVLYAKPNSDFINYLIEKTSNFDYVNSYNGYELGPHLLSEMIKDKKLQHLVSPKYTVYPIHYADIHKIFENKNALFCQIATRKAFSLHLWRTTFRDSGWLNRIPEKGSFYRSLFDKHMPFKTEEDWKNL